MGFQSLSVNSQPFQGSEELVPVNITETDVTFVNDGYTVLYVRTALAGAETTTLTIQSVPDNAARLDNITKNFVAADTGDVYMYGPFRPIWWNYGGVVRLSFDDVTALNIGALAVSYTF